jgi:hypothetical protein
MQISGAKILIGVLAFALLALSEKALACSPPPPWETSEQAAERLADLQRSTTRPDRR